MKKYVFIRTISLILLAVGTIWLMYYNKDKAWNLIGVILLLIGSIYGVMSENEYWQYLIKKGKIREVNKSDN